MKNSGKIENLHSHTKTSDGSLTYERTIEVCEENEIGVIAFTDHDGLMTPAKFAQLKKIKTPVDWISGIEISSGLPKELGGRPTSNFHIVGLFVDPAYKPLIDYCRKIREARKERTVKMVNNLISLGFRLTVAECLEESEGEAIGRPHIVAALLKKEANLAVMKKLLAKVKSDGQKDEAARKFHEGIISGRESQIPYRLFLDDGAYFPGIFIDYLYGLSLDESVALIHKAGGVAILAHWSFCKNKVDLAMVEKLLAEKRLDGVEVIFGLDVFERATEIREDWQAMKVLALKYNALQSGGMDSHHEPDLLSFARKPEARETAGMVSKLLASGKIKNKGFSSSLV